MNDASDRRRFWRTPFQAQAYLIDLSGSTPVELLDIALKGALLGVPDSWAGRIGDACRMELRLAEDITISMTGSVAHVEARRVGMRCDDIDVDSMTHLRRLVELNAGDPELLNRELSALIAG